VSYSYKSKGVLIFLSEARKLTVHDYDTIPTVTFPATALSLLVITECELALLYTVELHL